ncbi:ADP-dependent glucokinase/phosphofructokinase [Microbacterium timonense]|uniref:ADP-dependent glucokinase/phosphofructokinase n=1 Tax=Microbacterium timonense TaxID=2086576 RepID=UPI000D10056E|nr:ADP-dependent glucokinase/phosphofructokinase [Microbacterium timonense]
MTSQLVLGLGGTVDYEIAWDPAVLEALALEHGIRSGDLDASIPVDDERSLVITVLALLRDGRGGERFVSSVPVLERFASRFRYAKTLGGTCVRAALAMARLGVGSTVHLVSIDDTVRTLLPPEVSWVSSAKADSTEPHVIVQYPAGAVVRLPDAQLVAPHPNRLIFVNDLPNRELVIAPELPRMVAKARVFLASGFNTIQDAEILDDRLATVVEAIRGRSAGAVAVFEDAGSHDVAHGLRVRDAMAAVVDVYGLNEDELFGYLGGAFDLLDPDAAERALRRATELIPAPTLVVHTKHWAVAVGRDSGRWRAALEGAVTMAGTRFRVGDGLTRDEYAATRRIARQAAAVVFANEIESRFAGGASCVPAYDLNVASPTTIGLGDTFVGGFIAALATPDERRTDAGASVLAKGNSR